MPRGRPRNNPTPELTPEEQALREQTPPVEPELETPSAEQTAAGETPAQEEQVPHEQTLPVEPQQETPGPEQTAAAETPAQEEPALQDQQTPAGPELNEEPLTLAEYLIDSVREFMRDFGINGHSPESVYAAIMGKADQFRADQPVQSEQQERSESPMEPAIPLGVRINSLEMDGDTRAFAAAEYGDLTINRIRVKQDEYGTLSVAMPKFRQTGGWKETCSFNTVEARNRLTGAVLDSYEQTLAQLQGQTQTAADAQELEQVDGPEEGPEFEEPGQSGPVMGMSQW